MMRLLTWICVLAVVASCVPTVSTKPPAKPAHKTEVITVFLTGNELGALKPCGCSGGQLGGFDRRWAVLNSVPPSKRLIIDTGWFVRADREQDLIKFNMIIDAFGLLGYDLVNLTEKDIEIAGNLGLLDGLTSVFNIISPQSGGEAGVPAKFTKQLLLKDKIVAVTVATFDSKSAPLKRAEELFSRRCGPQTVNILILNRCDAGVIASAARMGDVFDCLICPAESDEPRIISDPNKRPLIVSAGRYGKYVGRLQISAAEDRSKIKFSFLPVPVDEDLPQDESLVELYKTYQKLVKEANLLEKQPRFALPNALQYVGSISCGYCHDYEYEKWSDKAHARAYATLERVGSQYDPECVACHVVGVQYEGGFVSEEKTGYLKNVGCESCHGPGLEHIRTLGKAEPAEPMLDCTDCHTPEQSTNYAGNEQLYFEKIIHWREPNAVSDVKEKGEPED